MVDHRTTTEKELMAGRRARVTRIEIKLSTLEVRALDALVRLRTDNPGPLAGRVAPISSRSQVVRELIAAAAHASREQGEYLP